jgi:hypothetical protein
VRGDQAAGDEAGAGVILGQPMIIIDDVKTATCTKHTEIFCTSHTYEVGDRIIVGGGVISRFSEELEVISVSMNRLNCILRDHVRDWVRDIAWSIPKNYRWYDRFRTHKPYQFHVAEHMNKPMTRIHQGFSVHQHRMNKRKFYIQSLKIVDTLKNGA